MIYCIVPRELAAKLHDPLRRHFRDDPYLDVIVERRRLERRAPGERRAEPRPSAWDEVEAERRRIRNRGGRRIGDRRARLAAIDPPPELPRRFHRYADRLVFVERLESAKADSEDLEVARSVTRFQSGDRDAFAELYLRYFDRVYGYLRLLLRDPHEAEDATQQVFLNVFRSLAGYERRRPFGAWLFTIVRNHALNRLRETDRTRPLDPEAVEVRIGAAAPDDHEPDQFSALGWISDRELLLFVERLPLAQRQAIVLRHVLGMSAAEIGEILDRSPDDVRMLQHRAHGFLRARLASVGRGPRRSTRRVRMRTRGREATVLRARRFSLR